MTTYPYILSGLSQGEIDFTLEKDNIDDGYASFTLTSYSSKWNLFDLSFEYKINESDKWMEDANIVSSTSSYVQGNCLIGVSAAEHGAVTKFKWKYSYNNIIGGMNVQVKARILPRIRHFSNYQNSTIISEAYGKSLFDLHGILNQKCIGIDLSGQYVCSNGSSISILDSLNGSIISSYSGLINPSFVKQMYSGHYIVADYGNNRILELDEELVTIEKEWSVSNPVYFDFSEPNETLLITSYGVSSVQEITWGEEDFGTVLWQSDNIFSNVTCSTYNRNNYNEIVSVDSSNCTVVLFDRNNDTYSIIDEYGFSNGTAERKWFWKPYRCYFYDDNTICIVEKDGEEINFETLRSSSSSSIDSSSSSSSSSNSSSSSSTSQSSSSSSTSNSSSSSSSTSNSSSSSSNNLNCGIGCMEIENNFIVA